MFIGGLHHKVVVAVLSLEFLGLEGEFIGNFDDTVLVLVDPQLTLFHVVLPEGGEEHLQGGLLELIQCLDIPILVEPQIPVIVLDCFLLATVSPGL